MISMALLFSFAYYFVVERTGSATSQAATISFTNASESKYVMIHSINSDSIIIKPTATNSSVIYQCLIDGKFFDKMTEYGMHLKDFLSLTGEEVSGNKIIIQKTNGFTVLNYVTTPSEKLSKGKVYYLIVGKKNADNEFTNENSECIKIQI